MFSFLSYPSSLVAKLHSIMATTEKGKMDLTKFYKTEDPEISDQARAILTQYSKIPESELVPHVRAIVGILP